MLFMFAAAFLSLIGFCSQKQWTEEKREIVSGVGIGPSRTVCVFVYNNENAVQPSHRHSALEDKILSIVI